jgi:hypothetical protein
MPQIGFCEEKSRLLSDFLQSVRELSAIQNEQTQAVIDGDSDFSRFDVLLHLAQEKKDRGSMPGWLTSNNTAVTTGSRETGLLSSHGVSLKHNVLAMYGCLPWCRRDCQSSRGSHRRTASLPPTPRNCVAPSHAPADPICRPRRRHKLRRPSGPSTPAWNLGSTV